MYKSYLLDLNKTGLLMFMINIIKQEIPIGKSNLAYIEPYKVIINNIMFLFLIILMKFISKTLVIIITILFDNYSQ